MDTNNRPLLFPFGVSDLAAHDGGYPFDVARFDSVSTWIGVGGDDANPADLPRAWDPFLGTTRVQRAQVFTDALRKIGADVHLTIFPGDTHALTSDMRQAACAYLAASQTANGFGDSVGAS
jgi:hypothetical protein